MQHAVHDPSDPSRPPWAVPGRYRPPPASTTMRISDADRTTVTNALSRHFADGRIDEAELDDRVARALAARTQADLAPLLADLPPLDIAVPAPLPRRRRHVARTILVGAVLVLALLALADHAAAHLHLHVPWLILLLLLWLLVHRGRSHPRHRYPH